jgi:hypothetical protein
VIALYPRLVHPVVEHRHDHGAAGEVEIDIRSAGPAPVAVVLRRRLLDLDQHRAPASVLTIIDGQPAAVGSGMRHAAAPSSRPGRQSRHGAPSATTRATMPSVRSALAFLAGSAMRS